MRYAIVVTDVNTAKKWLTWANEEANKKAFTKAFEESPKTTGVWTKDFDRTVSELYKEKGIRIFKTTNAEKTVWAEIK